ncbi:hypothetical protein PS870_01755 [Pseudomonas fluorescens]|uniref:RHS repeat-associated core domain-containing protein n=1 Tax=Pseudomonas fluorescens TaxID=294 RepID=A0A5E7ITA2_PSEFL|nr:RHS repeat-associated core domain-containing protein [Pseudomonas fluorescens]VVO80229.1 hypothetical protein PS870_01755 [Pseudomonas fluorescens]
MEDELEQLATDYLSSVLGFNGERIDPVLGGYHLGNGYRLYSPSLRRFTSPDSMSPFGQGGINPYAYCEGDPINNTDPTGHVRGGVIHSIFGGVVRDAELVVVNTIPGVGEEVDADLVVDETLAGRRARGDGERAAAPGSSGNPDRERRGDRSREERRDTRQRSRSRSPHEPGPLNIRPAPDTDTRLRGSLAQNVRADDIREDEERMISAHEEADSILNGFSHQRESYETSRRMIEDLNPLHRWMDIDIQSHWAETQRLRLQSLDFQQGTRLRSEEIASMQKKMARMKQFMESKNITLDPS